MISIKKLLLVVITLSILVFGTILFFNNQETSEPSGYYELKIGSNTVWVDIAQAPEKRRRGLMGRDFLRENEGMLFVFPEDDFQSFWMKDTYIPLSLAYIKVYGKGEGVITEIIEMEPYDGRPVDKLPSYRSSQKVSYALEMSAGWFERNRVKTGERVTSPILKNH